MLSGNLSVVEIGAPLASMPSSPPLQLPPPKIQVLTGLNSIAAYNSWILSTVKGSHLQPPIPLTDMMFSPTPELLIRLILFLGFWFSLVGAAREVSLLFSGFFMDSLPPLLLKSLFDFYQ